MNTPKHNPLAALALYLSTPRTYSPLVAKLEAGKFARYGV